MKAYTSLEQSKKLAEILPLESADMHYSPIGGTHPWVLENDLIVKDAVLCWSLAALLDVLPRVDIEKEIWFDDTYSYRVKAYIGDGYVGDWFDNPIDACYDMIIKLHELKLL